jgi:hypothetical protein
MSAARKVRQVRHQRDAARRRHAGVVNHRHSRRADAAEGRGRGLPEAVEHGRQADTSDQTVVHVDKTASLLYVNASPSTDAAGRDYRLQTIMETAQGQTVST